MPENTGKEKHIAGVKMYYIWKNVECDSVWHLRGSPPDLPYLGLSPFSS